MPQFDTLRVSLSFAQRRCRASGAGGSQGAGEQLPSRLRYLSDQERLVSEPCDGIHARHAEFIQRIAIIDDHRAYLDLLGELDLHIRTGNPELLTALVNLVGDANRSGIQILVQTGNRRFEKYPAGERLEFVIHKSGQRQRPNNH